MCYLVAPASEDGRANLIYSLYVLPSKPLSGVLTYFQIDPDVRQRLCIIASVRLKRTYTFFPRRYTNLRPAVGPPMLVIGTIYRYVHASSLQTVCFK